MGTPRLSRLVVTDTGPLIHLAQADVLHLLELVGEIQRIANGPETGSSCHVASNALYAERFLKQCIPEGMIPHFISSGVFCHLMVELYFYAYVALGDQSWDFL